MEYGEHASYMVLAEGTDVVSSDGVVVGKVTHVLADDAEDVFDGVVIDVDPGPGGKRFVDADQVGQIYERALVLRISADEVGRLPEPTPSPAVMQIGNGSDGWFKRTWGRITGKY